MRIVNFFSCDGQSLSWPAINMPTASMLELSFVSAKPGKTTGVRQRTKTDKVAHNLSTSSIVPLVTTEALGARALAEGRASWTRLRRRRFMVLVPPRSEEPEHLLRAACVEIKFQAPHAIDATLSS